MQMEELVLRIQTHAYHRALVIAHERRAVIETVAEELLSNADATVPGSRLDELMQQPPAAVPDDVIAELPFQNLVPAEVRSPERTACNSTRWEASLHNSAGCPRRTVICICHEPGFGAPFWCSGPCRCAIVVFSACAAMRSSSRRGVTNDHADVHTDVHTVSPVRP